MCWRLNYTICRYLQLSERERCPFAVVGEATDEHQIKVGDSHFDNNPVDLPKAILFGKPPKMHREIERITHDKPSFSTASIDINDAIERILRLPTVASKTF